MKLQDVEAKYPEGVRDQNYKIMPENLRYQLIESLMRNSTVNTEYKCRKDVISAIDQKLIIMKLKNMHKRKMEVSLNRNYYWITINPVEGDFDKFKDKLDYVLSLKNFSKSNYHYVYEQRGKTLDDMGRGYHVHMLCDKPKNTTPSQMTRELFNNFKHFCGNLKAIQVQTIPQTWYSDKIEYLKGNKWDDDKDESVFINKPWRESRGLKHLYSQSI